MESESVDISSIKWAALAPPETPGPLNLERDTQANNHLEVIHGALQPPTAHSTTETPFQPAQYLSELDSLAHLASTVPDSQILPQTDAVLQTVSLPQAAINKALLKMSSPRASPNDTQPLSPSIYDNIIVKNRSEQQSEQNGQENRDHDITQGTLNEGDEGHLDLLSSYHQDATGGGDDQPQLDDFSPTQTQTRLPEFPESQRFKTPATAGKKRDYNGEVISTPALPRNPLLRSGDTSSGRNMGLSQAFAATQAASSPYLHNLPQMLPSDLPSPDIELRARPVTVTSSSPLLGFHRNGKEPLARYVPVKESQAGRDFRAQSEPTDQNFEESEDDFDEEPSLLVRQRRMKERDLAAKQQLKAASSPKRPADKIKYHVSSSPIKPSDFSPRASPRGYGRRSRRIYLPGLINEETRSSRDTFKPNDSEEETDRETEIEIAVKRSSQVPFMTEEDKENAPFNALRIPETTARLQQVMNVFTDEESSPSDRHHSGASRRIEPQTFAVANSQPSQSGREPPFKAGVKLVSSGEGTDFVPQSQPNLGGNNMSPGFATGRGAHPRGLDQAIDEEEKDRLLVTEPSGINLNALHSNDLLFETNHGCTILESTSAPPQNPTAATSSGSVSSIAETGARRPRGLRSQTHFETAPSHMSEGASSPMATRSISPARASKSPRMARRTKLTDILEQASPERSSSGIVQEMLAELQDSDLREFLASQSPIRPARYVKRNRGNRKAAITRAEVDSVQSAPIPVGSVGRPELSLDEGGDLNESSGPDTSPKLAKPATRSSLLETRRIPVESPVSAISVTAIPTSKVRKRRGRPSRSIWDVEASPPAKKPELGHDNEKEPEIPNSTRTRRGKLPKPASSTTHSTPGETGKPPSKDKTATRTTSPASAMLGSSEKVRNTAEGNIVAPNQIWACFNGKTRAYYPARCIGISGSDILKYRVEWEGYPPEEVDAYGVRRLDLRIGDVVKVNVAGFPKLSHVIRGFKDRLEVGQTIVVTDIRGYKTLQLAPKQRKSLPADLDTDAVVEAPVGSIYLDSNMWGQMKERDFQYTPPAPPESQSGFATPTERSSTPSTPSSRSRRNASGFLAVQALETVGIFSDMAFAISYDDRTRKTELTNMIRTNGGLLLDDGFHELLENSSIELKPRFANLGFTALLADRHSRKEKYMQALSLNLPCISGKWINSCISKQAIVDWQSFLLPAGESVVLEGATRSRVLPNMDPATTKLGQILGSRPNLLSGADVIIVTGKGKAEDKRKPYAFLAQALGAGRIEKVPDAKTAKAYLKDHGSEWVFVDDRDVETTKGLLEEGGKARAGPRVVGNEFIVQSLVLGDLLEE